MSHELPADSGANPGEDRELVEHCLSGAPQAWTLLYERCHDYLLRAIRQMLGKSAADFNLVDEIAARVWYAVVRNNGELLSRFDASRGCRLTTFLAILARSEARQYFRGERRRKAREETASQWGPTHQRDDFSMMFDTEDGFVSTLTPAELEYYKTVLMAAEDTQAESQYTRENAWQLRHRVRTKLRRFLDSNLG